jgi:hypothetical protein
MAGRLEVCELLVGEGADVSAQDHFGYAALHYAAEHGRPAECSFLLQAGADFDAKTAFGFSAMQMAVPICRGALRPKDRTMAPPMATALSGRSPFSSPPSTLTPSTPDGQRVSLIAGAMDRGLHVDALDITPVKERMGPALSGPLGRPASQPIGISRRGIPNKVLSKIHSDTSSSDDMTSLPGITSNASVWKDENSVASASTQEPSDSSMPTPHLLPHPFA